MFQIPKVLPVGTKIDNANCFFGNQNRNRPSLYFLKIVCQL
jgi:hypothetical protein